MTTAENQLKYTKKGSNIWPFICLALTVALACQNSLINKSEDTSTLLQVSLDSTQKQLSITKSALEIADSLIKKSNTYSRKQKRSSTLRTIKSEGLKEGALLGHIDPPKVDTVTDTVVVVSEKVIESYQQALLATARVAVVAIEDNAIRDSVIEAANKTLNEQLDAQIAELRRENSKDKRDNILIGIGGAIAGFIAKSIASKGKEE